MLAPVAHDLLKDPAEIRAEAGLSIIAVAERAGVCRSTLKSYELSRDAVRGSSRVRLDRAYAQLARELESAVSHV